jgi:hypothetical protein
LTKIEPGEVGETQDIWLVKPGDKIEFVDDVDTHFVGGSFCRVRNKRYC